MTIAHPIVDLSPPLSAAIARCRVPAVVAAVLCGDTLVALGAAGVRRRGDTTPISVADRFHLGSCTKAMTATLVGLVVEDGQLDWSTSLHDIFGPKLARIHRGWREAQVRHVLAHRAGLLANPGGAFMAWIRWSRLLRIPTGSPSAQRRGIARQMLRAPPASPPGAIYDYSNTGYIIMGAALELLTGRPWEQLIRQRLWAPLGITTGGFGAPAANTDAPWGHEGQGIPIAPGSLAADWLVPPVYGPAGTVHMAVSDWARFAALHLKGDERNPRAHPTHLHPSSFAALHTPTAGEDYVGGWEVGDETWARGHRSGDTGRTLQHDGSNRQWYSKVWLAPEIDLAVLVATNQNGESGRNTCEQVRGDVVTLLPSIWHP